MSVQLFQKIEKPSNGRRFAVGDIHGCCQTFKKMVEETLVITKADHLYLLGDYIDKGPDSAGTLDYIIGLKAQGYQVFCIRGNHEENLLEAWQEYDSRTFKTFVTRINKSGDLLTEDAQIKPAYLNFFKTLPYYIELDDFYLVHAGFDFSKDNFLVQYDAMLRLRGSRVIPPNAEVIKGKTILHGHEVFYLDDIVQRINARSLTIPLDNGCVYTKKHKRLDYTKTGRLCAFNLDTFGLIAVENVDKSQ
jgi:serine/threonine protein phosphatase 1